MDVRLLTLLCAAFAASDLASARSKRCYVCRSRGPRGDCKDPFWWNATTATRNDAIELSPCASGWCGKAVEGKDGEHLQATERICLQRAPSDHMERCSDTMFENKRTPVFMCFCKGDLCNHAGTSGWGLLSFALPVAMVASLL